ncbi:hypothetical protein TNCV_765971 [Trichonephila clavipes]|nr:hypothetical protein TNCV_765971 [Trichonephila clavipes]
MRCWFNDRRSVSVEIITHAQSVEGERVAADRCARGYSSVNHEGKKRCAEKAVTNRSAQRRHQCETLLQNPHLTHVRHSKKETRALE